MSPTMAQVLIDPRQIAFESFWVLVHAPGGLKGRGCVLTGDPGVSVKVNDCVNLEGVPIQLAHEAQANYRVPFESLKRPIDEMSSEYIQPAVAELLGKITKVPGQFVFGYQFLQSPYPEGMRVHRVTDETMGASLLVLMQWDDTAQEIGVRLVALFGVVPGSVATLGATP